MFPGIIKYFICNDLLPAQGEIHQQNSRIKIRMICSEADLIYIICQFSLASMGGRSEEISLHVCFPERPQRIDDEDIRVEIEDAV